MRTQILAVVAASAMAATGLVAAAAPAHAATPPAPFTSVGTTTYTVPAGIRVLKIVTDGAGGGGNFSTTGGYTASGGSGARVTTYVSVVQGDVLNIGVGGGGAAGGGGAGGGSSSYVTGTTGPNDTSLLIVAGGGGGAARNGGGDGGRPNGSNGANGRQEGGENNGGRGGSGGNGGAPGPDGTQGTAGLAWASNGTGGTGGTGATGGGKAAAGGSGSNATVFTGGGGGGYGGGGGGSATSEAPFGGAGGGGGSTSNASASGYTTTYTSAENFGWAGRNSNCIPSTSCPPVDQRSQPFLPNNSYWYWGLPGGDGKVTITFEEEDITNTSPPVIGTAPVFTGIPLTITTPSVWSVVDPTIVRQWQYYDADEDEFLDIVDANEETYSPTGLTVGRVLRLKETVMNGEDPVTVYSNELGPVDGWITPPEIAGETMVGETLSLTTPGTYQFPDGTVAPTGIWQRYESGAWTDIAGETGATYVTTDSDVGFKLRYNESTTASSIPVSQGSNEIGPITGPTNLTPPTVSPNEHQMFNIELTATPGTWGPDSGIWQPTVTGIWQEFTGGSWVDIAGETGLTFTPDSTYVGKKVRYQETGTANSESTLAESNEVTITGPAPTTDPSIAGTRAVGETLTATPGDYSAIDQEATFSLTAIWQVFDGTSWVDITGETGTTLLLKEPQIGKLVRYLETASLEGIEQETPSNDIGPIGGPELISAPVIAQEGPDLTVTDPGEWGVSEEVPDVTVAVAGKWQVRDGMTWVDLGVTTANLPITPSLDGKTVRWLGTGSLGDVDVDSASNEIGPLVVPIATGAPVVDGSTDVGGTVTATPGTWGPGEGMGGPPVVTGQWQVLKNGEWVDIAGQTELALVTTTDVVGRYVRYVETGTIDGVSTTSESNQFGPIVGKDAPPVIKLNVSGSPSANKFKIGWKKPRGSEAPIKYRVTLKQKGFKRIIIRKAVTPPKTSVTVTRKALLKASVLPRGDMALVRYRVFVEAVYPASTSRLKGSGFWVRL